MFYYKSATFNIYFIKERLHKTEPPKLSKDRFLLVPRSLLFNRHHFLFEIFDRKLLQYIEGDLIGYNLRFWELLGNPKRLKVDKEPFSVLTLRELEAGFVICFVPLVLCFLVFAIEWMLTLKNLLVFLIFFQNYFEIKKIEQSKHSELIKIKFAQLQAAIQSRTKN